MRMGLLNNIYSHEYASSDLTVYKCVVLGIKQGLTLIYIPNKLIKQIIV